MKSALIIPIYRGCPIFNKQFLSCLTSHNVKVIIINNNNEHDNYSEEAWARLKDMRVEFSWCENANRNLIAGAIHQGVGKAQALDCKIVTLLDQDSTISAMDVLKLQRMVMGAPKLIVGPTIIDARRIILTNQSASTKPVLITSGCTFQVESWLDIGEYRLDFHIDYLDHEWSFRAQAAGYQTKIVRDCILHQQFGERHPSKVARLLGCELYPPLRHEYAIRNLKRMLALSHVPLWWKGKELAKMLVKPIIWLASEPNKKANMRAVLRGLFLDKLPT